MGRTAPTGTCCEDTLLSQAGQTDVPVRCGASSKHNPRPKGYNPSAVPTSRTRRKGRERTSFPSGPTGISEASKRHLAVHTLPSHLHPPFSGVLIKVARGEKPAPQKLVTASLLDLPLKPLGMSGWLTCCTGPG